MAKNLTQLAVSRFRPPAKGRAIHWDGLLPGFGLRISASGHRSWVAMFRVKGRPVMQTLGTLAQIPKLDDARQRAREAIVAAKSGVNPVEVRRAEEVAAKQETVDAVIDRYLHDHVDRNLAPGWARETRRMFEHDILPRWGDRPIRSITRQDVNDLLDTKADRRERSWQGRKDGAGVMANRLLTLTRHLFNWAESRDLVDANPTAGVRGRVKEAPRDRILDDGEIVRFWTACETLGPPFASLFRLLLLTGQRRDEVGELPWSELDLEQRTWTLPVERAKNDKVNVTHLSDFAIEIIKQLPRIGDSDFVFTTNGRTPVTGFSRAKRRLDELMGDPPAWTLHDLRRTATSGMARLNVPPHVVDKILNHTAGTIRGVAAIYNRFEYLPERKAALDAWGRFIEALVRPSASNVTPLRRGGTSQYSLKL
jgi:integrase